MNRTFIIGTAILGLMTASGAARAQDATQPASEPATRSEAQPAAGAAPAPEIRSGGMLYGPDGNRVGTIYRVTAAGDARVILNGKLVTVPAATLSEAQGKVATSLSKRELGRAK